MCVCKSVSVCMVVIWLYVYSPGSDDKESACNAGDLSSIPASGRFPGQWNDRPPQDSFLENSMDRIAWGLHCLWGHKESEMPE